MTDCLGCASLRQSLAEITATLRRRDDELTAARRLLRVRAGGEDRDDEGAALAEVARQMTRIGGELLRLSVAQEIRATRGRA